MRIVAIAMLLACGHPGTPASSVDWSKPPGVGAGFEIAAPPIEDIHLGNGMRVLLVENHRLPIVEISTLHHGAGSREDGARPGLAALTLDLLDEGNALYTASELARALQREGATLELTIASDYARAQLVTLSNHLSPSLELLAGVITRTPASGARFARIRDERIAEMKQHLARSRTFAAQAFDRLMFAGFPYAQPAEGTPAVVVALTDDDVRAFWRTAYGPATTTMIVAGDVARGELIAMLEHSFGAWQTAQAAHAPPPLLPAPPPQLVYVDEPGEKTSIVIGRRVPVTNDLAAEVANMVLGGNVDARLNRKLRDELGITFGASASFWRGEWAATWGVATVIKPEATADGIRAVLALIESMRTIDVPAGELRRVKSAMARGVAQAFDNTATTVRAIEYLVAQGLPLDYYATYASHLDAVTAQAARSAIAQQWSDLSIVIVGDWSVIGDRVRALGLPVTAAP